MEQMIRIQGGHLLSGNVEISGSKNLCVALLPATLLCRGKFVLKNIPPISDVFYLVEILKKFHAKVTYHGTTLQVDTREIVDQDLLFEEMHQLRASYYFYGVMLGKKKKLKAKKIGGCKLGSRPIDLHLDVFAQMGVQCEEKEEIYEFDVEKARPTTYTFPKLSVGATINAVLLAIQIPGTSQFKNIALEPEVTEFLRFLHKMGADIEGIRTDTITIHGGKELHGVHFENIPDRIEVGTFALLGAAIGNSIHIHPVRFSHIQSLLHVLDSLRIPYERKEDTLTVSHRHFHHGLIIETAPYPGFPTDLQQPLTALLSSERVLSIVRENVYPERFAHVPELNKLGATIERDGRTLYIYGTSELKGAELSGKDLRGSASLVMGGLMAKGETLVHGVRYLNRGYESMIEKLKKLHANIEIVEVEQ